MKWLIALVTALLQAWRRTPSRLETQTDRAARAEAKLEQAAKATGAQAAIARAVTDAPKDVAGVAEQLRKGEF